MESLKGGGGYVSRSAEVGANTHHCTDRTRI